MDKQSYDDTPTTLSDGKYPEVKLNTQSKDEIVLMAPSNVAGFTMGNVEFDAKWIVRVDDGLDNLLYELNPLEDLTPIELYNIGYWKDWCSQNIINNNPANRAWTKALELGIDRHFSLRG